MSNSMAMWTYRRELEACVQLGGSHDGLVPEVGQRKALLGVVGQLSDELLVVVVDQVGHLDAQRLACRIGGESAVQCDAVSGMMYSVYHALSTDGWMH